MHTSDVLQAHIVVVVGGVISGVGKGVATASIGKIFQECGYTTTIIKIDPYINYDAGTLRPTEHGEVWVTEDGGEIDQDLGTYERFIGVNISRYNNITTGQIYKSVIDRERRGEYLGQTVQFIPHIIDEIVQRVKTAAKGYEIVVVEVGGTVGDYENAPFLYALKALERDLGPRRVLYALVTYLPIPGHIGEMKTKPTQQAIRRLGEHGILPDFIICRSDSSIDETRRRKIVECAHINPANIIAAPNVSSVYEIPLEFERQELSQKMLAYFDLQRRKAPCWDAWQKRVSVIKKPKHTITVGIVGKYIDSGSYSLTDSYLSVYHALIHAGAELEIGINIQWISTQHMKQNSAYCNALDTINAIVVPGGFGTQGVEEKIAIIRYARTQRIPFLGLCYGFQLAIVEFARSVCGIHTAHTTEVDPQTTEPVIHLLPMQQQHMGKKTYGASMRLGAYTAHIKCGTQIARLYDKQSTSDICISERHRHRYEVNYSYISQLEHAGLLFSGYHMRNDGTQLMEFFELPGHPFFIGTQAHPEFKSRFLNANPLFVGLIHAAFEHHTPVLPDMQASKITPISVSL
jgi:CTP synthase